ncbi:fibronectin type III domain-containing protein [Paractinoplanes rhizophilus]|uniref:Fibronectin type III domain-containing protein n=1 Tax=Paractinoplanes rhizophilus TaxID=1416877 RepID=A0ABW2I457_9ACTN|nr:fibronectin type III domain-containing protein [Actinoplanes sp.]
MSSAPPIAELTQRAQTLSSAGDLQGARRVLAGVLDRAGATDPRAADPELALAAALHARILIALGDSHGARLWAAFAHEAEERLHGPRDERTVAAAATHAAILQRVGHHGRAAQVYERLVNDLTAMDGPDSPRVLAAEADLATAEHAAGHCTSARSRLTGAWVRHRHRHGDAAPAGIKMLARLGAMERECARDAESAEHLALAQELCARYLPADHPLVRQVAALATAPASGRHVCGRVEQSAGPPSVPFPRRPAVPDPEQGGDFPPDDPLRPPPDNRPTDPNGTVYQQPLYLSDVARAPGDLTGRHARADTPPPMPGQRTAGDGRPVGAAPASTLATPPNSERLLPVPAEQPVAPRRRQPFLLVAVLIAGIAVAVAVIALTLPDAGGATGAQPTVPVSSAPVAAGPASSAPPTSAPPTSAAPTGDPGAPTGVKLKDNRDSVSLSWAYPKDAEGPVLISGGRTGQPLRAFQQLPAGTTDYMVYGLNATQNYCFKVSVAYSTDRIAASAPVCTER